MYKFVYIKIYIKTYNKCNPERTPIFYKLFLNTYIKKEKNIKKQNKRN